ncbi:uncharacterized protein LOC122466171 [Chelonia mydas]|uniref:uncharacterized protein LOC122466171 n=1 Tax=Chelonia mydas TaxID=8469 RepID=UPI001CA93F2C|nr:uncharacterized protein LOC122466171 [Chelonia mydas]
MNGLDDLAIKSAFVLLVSTPCPAGRALCSTLSSPPGCGRSRRRAGDRPSVSICHPAPSHLEQQQQELSFLHLSGAETPSAQLQEVEAEDVSPEQASIRVIQQHLQGRDEELTEDLPMESEPSSTLSSSMAAVRNLSKLKPPLVLELESRLLQAVLYTIFTMGTGKDTTHFRTCSQSLDSMLRSLLTETPTKDKLQRLLEVSRLGGP